MIVFSRGGLEFGNMWHGFGPMLFTSKFSYPAPGDFSATPQSMFRCVPDRQSSFCNAFLASAWVREGFPICHKSSEDFARVTHHRQLCSLVRGFKVALRLACIVLMMAFGISIPMTAVWRKFNLLQAQLTDKNFPLSL